MGLLSDITNIFSSIAKGHAYQNAAQAQVNGYDQGIDTLGNEQTRINGLLNPYETAGTSAVNAESNLLGLGGGDSQQAAINNLQASPLYQSLYRNGQEAILANGSATGGLRGGNMQSSLANFGSDTLARVIQQQLSNLGGLSGQGLNAIDTSGQLGAGTADGIASLQGAVGRANAGGILGKASADQGIFSSGGNILQSLLSAIPGGGFGGGSAAGGSNFFSNIASAF